MQTPEESPKAAGQVLPAPVEVRVVAPTAADRSPEKFIRRTTRRNVMLSVLTPIVALVLWEISSRAGLTDARFFPPPTQVFSTGFEMVTNGTLLANLWVTVSTLLIGLVIGYAAGVVVGVLMGLFRPLRAALEPLLSGLYTIPKIAILPLLVLIFGIGDAPRIIVVGIGSFFIAWITMLEATANVPHGYLETAESFNLTRAEKLRFVILPSTLPDLFVGMRIAVGNAVLLIVAVEFVVGGEGVGSMIWNSWTIFATGRMYAGIVIVALLGFVLSRIVTLAAVVAVPWAPKSQKRRS